jgi:hypothetical protein
MDRSPRIRLPLLFSLLLVLGITLPAAAQPYGSWLTLGPAHSYVSVPTSTSFNFSIRFTFEAWVSLRDSNGSGACSSIMGKNYAAAYWVGICGTQLRSYLRGSDSQFTGGTVPASDWTHIAVVWDGANHIHYVNGEEVARRAETGNMTGHVSDMRIGSDTAWEFTPTGAIDEVRFWNVARTRAEIRQGITVAYTTPQPGLVAQYHFDGNATDSAGTNHGTTVGGAAYLNAPVTTACTQSATALCITGNRFLVTTKYLTAAGASGAGQRVPGGTPSSGLFWFFGADNWEVLAKVIDGCGVNNRRWVFASASTDQHYELIVTDVQSGATRRYFNYLGERAPAITDTGAFACP